jgi:hypothetical protein
MLNRFLYYCLLLFLLSINLKVKAQTVPQGSRLLEKDTVVRLFTDSVKKSLKIKYPIHCVYTYKSKNKLHYMVIAERAYAVEKNTSRFDSIQMIDVVRDKNFKLNISLIDYKVTDTDYTVQPEFSIWFWTKYFSLSDLDGDGIVDPIIVYGTTGSEGKSDGRIKIVIFYKNKKHFITHQNSGQDYDRKTYVQKAFYSLPKKIQLKVTSIMEKIMEDNNGIFPAGWQKGMQVKKTFLYEKFN